MNLKQIFPERFSVVRLRSLISVYLASFILPSSHPCHGEAPIQYCVTITIFKLYKQFYTFAQISGLHGRRGLVFGLACTMNCGTFYRQVYTFLIYVHRWISSQVMFQRQLRTSSKQDLCGLNLKSLNQGSKYSTKLNISGLTFYQITKHF